jgi:uncharacterized protein (TIGR00255 family)
MTGYGQGVWQRGGRAVTVEIKAVNQRFLEVKLNMPREYQPWDAELRALVQEHVARGKVDIAVFRGGPANGQVSVEANVALARAYVEAWRRLQRDLQLPGTIDLNILQGRTELLRIVERRNEPSGEIDAVRTTLRRALRAFNRDREREGRMLARDMTARVRHLQQLHRRIAKRVSVLAPQLAERLRQRVAALLDGQAVTEERVLQEIALVVDRSDVTEELVRLASHLDGLGSVLRSREPAGKKIDFLLQEVHREFNTIASKSVDLEVTNHTLAARSEIEKLREQVQNVE